MKFGEFEYTGGFLTCAKIKSKYSFECCFYFFAVVCFVLACIKVYFSCRFVFLFVIWKDLELSGFLLCSLLVAFGTISVLPQRFTAVNRCLHGLCCLWRRVNSDKQERLTFPLTKDLKSPGKYVRYITHTQNLKPSHYADFPQLSFPVFFLFWFWFWISLTNSV